MLEYSFKPLCSYITPACTQMCYQVITPDPESLTGIQVKHLICWMCVSLSPTHSHSTQLSHLIHNNLIILNNLYHQTRAQRFNKLQEQQTTCKELTDAHVAHESMMCNCFIPLFFCPKRNELGEDLSFLSFKIIIIISND